jgi:hypothetical protein
MAGWSVTIVRQPVEDYPRNLDREKVLANWFVGSGGVRWIAELVSRGEAKRVKDGGYPNLYTAPAGVIAPLFAGGEPPSGETGMFGPREVTIRRAELDACPPDERLTIAVWDQS